MTIRRCVAYYNDLRGTLTFDLKVKQLKDKNVMARTSFAEKKQKKKRKRKKKSD
jgi:hypothetical protein